MKYAVDILSALAEPTRLAALRIIWDGHERCVCELMRELGVSQSRMSRHMGMLKNAGLVTDHPPRRSRGAGRSRAGADPRKRLAS
jgi:ArsR family transcriptional regulator